MIINELFNNLDYGDGMIYRDLNLFEFITSDEFTEQLDGLAIGENIYDQYDCALLETVDGQEVYLGYILETDVFVIGFDIFTDVIKSQIFYFKIDDESNVKLLSSCDYDTLFYNTKVGYNLLINNCNKNAKTLIDLRLD